MQSSAGFKDQVMLLYAGKHAGVFPWPQPTQPDQAVPDPPRKELEDEDFPEISEEDAQSLKDLWELFIDGQKVSWPPGWTHGKVIRWINKELTRSRFARLKQRSAPLLEKRLTGGAAPGTETVMAAGQADVPPNPWGPVLLPRAQLTRNDSTEAVWGRPPPARADETDRAAWFQRQPNRGTREDEIALQLALDESAQDEEAARGRPQAPAADAADGGRRIPLTSPTFAPLQRTQAGAASSSTAPVAEGAAQALHQQGVDGAAEDPASASSESFEGEELRMTGASYNGTERAALEQALVLLELPEAPGRKELRVDSFTSLRFHNDYYGVYLVVACGGLRIAAHITLLHCQGCRKSLTDAQLQRVEGAANTLTGKRVQLARSDLTREYRNGGLWRAFGFIDVNEDFNKALWALRQRLSAWLPSAAAREQRYNFHLSLDYML